MEIICTIYIFSMFVVINVAQLFVNFLAPLAQPSHYLIIIWLVARYTHIPSFRIGNVPFSFLRFENIISFHIIKLWIFVALFKISKIKNNSIVTATDKKS